MEYIMLFDTYKHIRILMHVYLVSVRLTQARPFNDFQNYTPGFVLFINNSCDEENPEIIPERNSPMNDTDSEGSSSSDSTDSQNMNPEVY